MPASPAKGLGLIILSVAILILAGWWIYRTYFDVYHLATVRDGVLYRDGIRSIGQFERAAETVHPKTIVSLVDDTEMNQQPFAQEMAYCQANGIQVVRVPIVLGGWPSTEQVREFLALVADPAHQPVLVHCAQGVRRTGMMVAAYQRSVLNMSKQDATQAVMAFGHSDRTVDDVKRFIDIYDPATKTVTQNLPQSRE